MIIRVLVNTCMCPLSSSYAIFFLVFNSQSEIVYYVIKSMCCRIIFFPIIVMNDGFQELCHDIVMYLLKENNNYCGSFK